MKEADRRRAILQRLARMEGASPPNAQPDTAEEAIEVARALAVSEAIDLIVIDSAAALVPRLEVDAGIGESAPGLHTRVLASELRKLSGAIRRAPACVLFLNQMRN